MKSVHQGMKGLTLLKIIGSLVEDSIEDKDG
jgi:hypothetical protein